MTKAFDPPPKPWYDQSPIQRKDPYLKEEDTSMSLQSRLSRKEPDRQREDLLRLDHGIVESDPLGQKRFRLTVAMQDVLRELGYDLTSAEMVETPNRWAEMMIAELTRGQEFDFTTFPNTEQIDQMITESNVPFFSLCAHHVIPFFGVAHIAYIPSDKIAGLSKLARVLEYHSKCLTTQEAITQKVLNTLVNILHPKGAAVRLQGRHLCMEMRGVEKPGTVTTTTALAGVIKTSADARDEFFNSCIRGREL
jgi:GTP cyclohydrolase IA